MFYSIVFVNKLCQIIDCADTLVDQIEFKMRKDKTDLYLS